MLSQEILDLIKEGKGVQARELTHDILNAKLSELIQDKYDEIAPTAFGEAKKAPKTDKEDDGEGMDPVGHADSDVDNDGDSDDSDDYLKNRRKTIKKAIKKESAKVEEAVTTTLKFKKDADGAAAVGSETSKKGLLHSGKKVKNGEYKLTFKDDKQMMQFMDKYSSKVDEAVSKRSAGLHKGGEHSYGVPTQTYSSASPEQKSSIKQKHYQDREGQERDKEARRKRDEREKEKKKREIGIGRGTETK